IGAAAPMLLGFARVIQGLSLGGEYGASATYLSEMADHKHRGFYSSFQYVTLIGGQLGAIIVLLVLQQVLLTPVQLKAWGWRIPFVIGALQPIYGAISDKVGRRWLLIWFGLMGTIFTIPLLKTLQSTKTAFGAFLLIAFAWIIVAGYTSINAVVKAELFPTVIRATGVGLP